MPAPSSSVPTWAAYLACSWTWCIGMFLPVLLVRDFSLPGFLVFALPNILGAAAMGRTITHLTAFRIRDSHAAVCRAFSYVTIAFHFAFLWWARSFLSGSWWYAAIGLVVLAGVIGALAGSVPHTSSRLRHAWTAWIVLAISLALGVSLVADAAALRALTLSFRLDSPDLLFLAPVCCFGFALCPYLDLTFLRARMANPSPRRSRRAYFLGFCVFFAAMILITLMYSPALLTTRYAGAAWGPVTLLFFVAHLSCQSAFTVGVHTAEFARASAANSRAAAAAAAALIACFALITLALPHAAAFAPVDPAHTIFGGLAPPEIAYRCFMAFYGLVFPVYVWIAVIPTQPPIPRPKTLAFWLAAVVLAAPFYWMGFIARQEIWLAPGLAIVLLARPAAIALARRGTTPSPEPPPDIPSR